MKKLALAATIALGSAATAAPAATPALWPHAYRTKVAGASVPALNGTWTLAIKKATFTVARDGALAVAGSTRISGSRITFRDRAGPLACSGAQAAGTYGWRVRGNRLTLTRVGDPCPGRRLILSQRFVRIA